VDRPEVWTCVAEPFWKWGGTNARQKTRGLNGQLWRHNHVVLHHINVITYTPYQGLNVIYTLYQGLNDVITYTPYEGLNFIILDKITLLWKRIGEPLAIKKAVTGATPGQQRHSGSSCDLFWLKNRSMLASLKFPFILVVIIVALWR